MLRYCVIIRVTKKHIKGLKMEEIFKDIENSKGQYQISNMGRVLSFKPKCRGGDTPIKPKVLREQSNQYGYGQYTLRIEGKSTTISTHKLVSAHFMNEIDQALEVDHIDGNKRNNRIDNLRMVTKVENLKQSHKRIRNYGDGKKNKLSGEDKKKIIAELLKGISLGVLSKRFSVSRTAIWKIKDYHLPPSCA